MEASASAEVLLGLIARPCDPEAPAAACAPASASARAPLPERRLLPARAAISRLPFLLLAVSAVEASVYLWGGPGARAALLFDPHRRRQLWRFASYMLLHADALHLALNVAIQLLVAAPLELEQGRCRTALVYVGGGVAGALGTSVLQPELYLLGASAGVYALLISHVANILLNFSLLRYKAYRSVTVVVLALADVAFSVHHHLSGGNVRPRVGLAAHCSGALAGLLLGLLLFRVHAPKPQAPAPAPAPGLRPKPLRWAAAALLGAGLTAAVVCCVLQPPPPQPQPQPQLLAHTPAPALGPL